MSVINYWVKLHRHAAAEGRSNIVRYQQTIISEYQKSKDRAWTDERLERRRTNAVRSDITYSLWVELNTRIQAINIPTCRRWPAGPWQGIYGVVYGRDRKDRRDRRDRRDDNTASQGMLGSCRKRDGRFCPTPWRRMSEESDMNQDKRHPLALARILINDIERTELV